MIVDRHTRYADLPELLTPEEFCACLGIGRTSVYEGVRTGAIPCVKFDRRIWIPKTILKADQSDKDNLVTLSSASRQQ